MFRKDLSSLSDYLLSCRTFNFAMIILLNNNEPTFNTISVQSLAAGIFSFNVKDLRGDKSLAVNSDSYSALWASRVELSPLASFGRAHRACDMRFWLNCITVKS